jgi:hypothetical protein
VTVRTDKDWLQTNSRRMMRNSLNEMMEFERCSDTVELLVACSILAAYTVGVDGRLQERRSTLLDRLCPCRILRGMMRSLQASAWTGSLGKQFVFHALPAPLVAFARDFAKTRTL